MITVKLPDGSEANFPDGTSQEEMESAISSMDSAEPQRNLEGATAATLSGIVNGIPIIGPASQYASDAMMGLGSMAMGGDYGETVDALQQRRKGLSEQYPISSAAGNVGGAGIGFGLAAVPTAGSKALGLVGSNAQRLFNGFVSSNGVGIADKFVRGQTR